jgi:hypothetical protein
MTLSRFGGGLWSCLQAEGHMHYCFFTRHIGRISASRSAYAVLLQHFDKEVAGMRVVREVRDGDPVLVERRETTSRHFGAEF